MNNLATNDIATMRRAFIEAQGDAELAANMLDNRYSVATIQELAEAREWYVLLNDFDQLSAMLSEKSQLRRQKHDRILTWLESKLVSRINGEYDPETKTYRVKPVSEKHMLGHVRALIETMKLQMSLDGAKVGEGDGKGNTFNILALIREVANNGQGHINQNTNGRELHGE